ncbi:MAG: radical SAM protein [Bacteroidia bacterium]|nr:radical SAM protein [Bacteroidia bacterium]
MKIVFTHGYFISEDPKELEIMRPYVPLGILYISAWLQKNNYNNEVFDSTFSTFELQKQFILDNKPDVLAIYTNLMTKLNVLRTIQFVKSQSILKHTKIVLGGPEVTNHIDKFLEHGADYIIQGEGEETMLELVQFLDQKSELNRTQIAGLSFKDEVGQTIFTNERGKLKNLDELPMPNRTKVNLQLYFDAWKAKHGTSAISINTMRGCPYSCKWCSRAVYGQSYRRRSAKHVVDEIEWIQNNYRVDSIWFVDDVFTVSHKWLNEFTQELGNRKLKIAYECITRADRMSEEVIDLLKESGCFRVWIGAESGSQKVIDLMDRRVDVLQVRDMIRKAQAKGVQAGTFIMVGYPGETEEDIFETIKHLKDSDPDIFTITIAYPIKGTPLFIEIESDITTKLPWELSTDRDIDFKRTYSRNYYNFAVKHIVNEVNAHKALKNNQWVKLTKFKIKSIAARGFMTAIRNWN